MTKLQSSLDKSWGQRHTRSRSGSEWLNETEASRYVGRHDEYLRKLRLEGQGPPATRIGRQWMRRRTDLDRFMDNPNSFA
jgi:hypothetical protein